MRKITWPLTLALGLGVFTTADAKVEHILPYPHTVTMADNAKDVAALTFAKGTTVTVSGVANNPTLARFFQEFGVTATFDANATGGKVSVKKVAKIETAFNHNLPGYDNEAYTLKVSSTGIEIEYVDEIGLTRAAQTLTQMAEGWTEEGVNLEAVTLVDWPAFKLRGIMHDVGRSFIEFNELKNQIDKLSRFKINTFHWHLTENLAWRFQIKAEAYKHLTDDQYMYRQKGKFYTQAQCAELVQYAAERGVTIIPEIDMPGHSKAFRDALGYDMQSEKGKAALKVILKEVVDVFTNSPYIHIGGDEQATTAAYLNEMIDYVQKTLHKKVVVWNPIKGVTVGDVNADMCQLWSTAGKKVPGKANIDCRYNYVNHFDVYADLVGIYKSNIYYEKQGTDEIAGSISATWNDTKTADDKQLVIQNNIYANALATAERAWKGGGERYVEKGGTTLPNSGSEFDEFVDFERRFLFHKAHSLQKEPIAYVKQTNVRWRITDPFPNDGNNALLLPPETSDAPVLPDAFEYNGNTYGTHIATGAGIYLRHIWHPTVPSFFANPGENQTAYAWTYVHSDKEQEVGAQIEFYTYSRSGNEKGPDQGKWDRRGSQVWVNGQLIDAPVWEQPGKDIPQDAEFDGLKNENFTAREVVKMTLKQGWNKVFLRLPHVNNGGTKRDKWQFTFVFTDPTGKNAAEGLVYSPNKCIDAAAEDVAMKISEVKAVRNTKVKDQPGYYDPALASELDAVISKIEATLQNEGVAAETRAQQKTELDNALKAFQTKLTTAAILMPKHSDSKNTYWYSLSTPLRGNRYASSCGANAEMMGLTQPNTSSYWKFVSRQDNQGVDIVNCADGTYVSPDSNHDTALKTQKNAPSKGWNFNKADEVGYMTITCGNVQFNQTGSEKVYNWGGGNNTSDTGCKYAIKKVALSANDLLQPKLSAATESYYYTLKSVKRENRFVTSKGAGQELIGESAESKAAYWKFMNRTDGNGYDIVNCADGTYLSPASANNTSLKSVAAVPNKGWTVSEGIVGEGSVIITSGDVELNQTDKTRSYKIFNWGAGAGQNKKDYGCIYQLTEVPVEKWETAVDAMPVVGNNYYFYNVHQAGNQHYYVNNNAMGYGTAKNFSDRAYVWTCEDATDGKFYFKNLATGQYFAWQGLSDNAYAWTVSDELKGSGASGVFNVGCVTMKGAEKFLVGKVGGFDQAIKAEFNNTTFSSDFKFDRCGLPVVGQKYYFYNKFPSGDQYFYDKKDGKIGFSKTKVQDNNTYVWICEVAGNGNYAFRNAATGQYFAWKSTNAAPCEWVVKTDNSGTFQVKNEGCVAMQAKNISGSNFMVCKEGAFDHANRAGFYGPGSNGTVFSSDFYFELIPGEVKVEGPEDFISTTYGEKWVRIAWNTNISHAMGFAEGQNFDGRATKSNQLDVTSKEQLWTLVGNNNDGFKMYNYTSGQNFALKIHGTEDGAEAKMAVDADASKWQLVKQNTGVYSVVPVGNTGMGLNSYGGPLNTLKLYNANDGGSKWQLMTVVPSFKLTAQLTGELDEQYTLGSGSLDFNIDGKLYNSQVSNVTSAVCYLPDAAKVKVSPVAPRGYVVNAMTVNGVEKNVAEFTIAPDMKDELVASFVASYEAGLYLYKTPGANGKPYRIPAIATAVNGDIIAISDFRPGGQDVGRGEVDIKYRISKDNGHSWDAEQTLVDGHWGSGEKWQYSFGDAAVVADCERNEVLIMMVCGDKNCWDGNYHPDHLDDPAYTPNRVARSYAKYDEASKSWTVSQPEEVSNSIYSLFVKKENGQNVPTVKSMFIGSGRICQSRVIKVGDYYRLYCSMFTTTGGNRVIYSDDFGKTWNILGSVDDRPAPNGDEPKCEELPDGSVILSSRKGGGRYFNIFTYNEGSTSTGKWGQVVESNQQPGGIADNGQATNGEIFSVNVLTKNGEKKTLMMQSEPWGPGRSNVGIYFKEIDSSIKYTPVTFASDWTRGLQVSKVGSAYSTMTLQKDNKIGFFFEENPGEYCMVYLPLTIEQITDGKYTLDAEAYGNFLTTHDANNLNCALATYSSKFVTTPNVAGVKAFYATEEAGNVVKMTEIVATDGKLVVPAHTGVLLQTDKAQKFSMLPTAVNAPALGENVNLLMATADGAVTVDPAVNAYILSGDADGVAFFRLSSTDRTIAANRAYLVLPAGGNTAKMSISFGDLTGIEGIEAENADAPVYDLSGRRVVKAVKGGVYIQNGKKFIVK